MAYPAAMGLLSRKLEDIDERMASTKLYVTQVRAEAASGPIPSTRIIDVAINLNQQKTALAALASAPGLAEYAKSQKNSQSLDIAAEYTGVIAAMDAVITWVVTNFPKDAVTGALLERVWGPSGPVDRTFTSAQTASLRTVLDTLAATIS